MKEQEIYKKAVNLWGVDSQVKMLIEECSELITALCKYKRKINGVDIDSIAEEVADVEIMIDQLKYIFQNESLSYKVDIKKTKKIERLESWIKKEEACKR